MTSYEMTGHDTLPLHDQPRWSLESLKEKSPKKPRMTKELGEGKATKNLHRVVAVRLASQGVCGTIKIDDKE